MSWHIGWWDWAAWHQICIFGQLDIAISVRLRGDSMLRCECFRGSSDTWALHLRKKGNKLSWKSQFYQWFSFFIIVLYGLHSLHRRPFWGLASFALDSAIFWWDERFAPYTPSREMYLNVLPASSHRVRFPILSATMMNTLHTFPATLCEKFRFPFFNFTRPGAEGGVLAKCVGHQKCRRAWGSSGMFCTTKFEIFEKRGPRIMVPWSRSSEAQRKQNVPWTWDTPAKLWKTRKRIWNHSARWSFLRDALNGRVSLSFIYFTQKHCSHRESDLHHQAGWGSFSGIDGEDVSEEGLGWQKIWP